MIRVIRMTPVAASAAVFSIFWRKFDLALFCRLKAIVFELSVAIVSVSSLCKKPSHDEASAAMAYDTGSSCWTTHIISCVQKFESNKPPSLVRQWCGRSRVRGSPRVFDSSPSLVRGAVQESLAAREQASRA